MWLENFETLLSEATTKWNITGDINIDFIGEQNESTKRYKNIVHSFNFHQYVTTPTRNGKSLIDSICSNVPNKLIHYDAIYNDEINYHNTHFVILNIKRTL